ncbi:MAG TPA: penicillin-binding protein activator [Methanocorpusculum sp.]|nr:penicillin-binding protein activator [Methanocorpusculum sp.]
MSHEHEHKKYFGGWKITAGIAVILAVVIAVLLIPALPIMQEKEPVEIPVLLPLSGEFKELGLELKSGIDLAFEDTGNRYTPVYYDTEGNPAKAINYAKSLYDDGHRIILGPTLSAEASSLAPYAEMLGILMVCPTATSEDLTQYPNYVFRLVSSDNYAGNGVVRIFTSIESVKNITVLWSMDDFGNSQYNAFMAAMAEAEDEWEDDGEEFPFTVTYILLPADLTNIKGEVAESHPDALYIIPKNPDEANRIIDLTYDEISEDVIRVVANTWYSSVVAANPNAEGIYAVNPLKEMNDPHFALMYQEKYGTSPSSEVVYYGYDAANLLIMAMGASSNNDPKEVSDILKETRYLGVTGAICFDENADRYPVYTIVQIQNGEWISLPWKSVFSFNTGRH